ncbi:MAG: hypothetical protein KC502_11400 [Myxococcales bacterium]|nr:hypothetical protein [Myxococcales bacterium]
MSSPGQVSDLFWEDGLVMRAGSNTWRLSRVDGERGDSAQVTDTDWRGPRVTLRLSKGGHRLTPRLRLCVGRKVVWDAHGHGNLKLDLCAEDLGESRYSPLFRYARALSTNDHKILRTFCGERWDILPWLRLIALSPGMLLSQAGEQDNLARLCASRLATIEPALLAHGARTPKQRQLTAWLGLSDAPWVSKVVRRLDLRGASPRLLSRLVTALAACIGVAERVKLLRHAEGLCAESVLALTHTSSHLSLGAQFLREITRLRGPDRRRLVNRVLPLIAAGARAMGKRERIKSMAHLRHRRSHGWEHSLNRRGKRRLLAQDPALRPKAIALFGGTVLPLKTAGALKREGARMRHCLGAPRHLVNLYNGTSRFFAISAPQRCTLQVHIDRHGLPHARQLHGVENLEVGLQTSELIELWLASLREAARGKAHDNRLRELADATAQVEPWFNALLNLPALRRLKLIVSPSYARAFPWTLGPHHVRRVDCMSSQLTRLTLRAPAVSYDQQVAQPQLTHIAEDMKLSFGRYGDEADEEEDDDSQMFDSEGREDRLTRAMRGFNFELDWPKRRVTPKDAARCRDTQVAGLFAILNCFDPDSDITVNLSNCKNLVGTFWEQAWSRRPWSLNLDGCTNLDPRRISGAAMNCLKHATQTAELRDSSRATLNFSDCSGLDGAVLHRLVDTGGVKQISLPDRLAAKPATLGPLLRSAAANKCSVSFSAERFASEALDLCVGSQLDLTLGDGVLDEQAMARIAGSVESLMLWDVTVSPAGWRQLAGGSVKRLYIYEVNTPPVAEQWLAVAECKQLERLVIETIEI